MGEVDGDPRHAVVDGDLARRVQKAEARASRFEAAFEAASDGVALFEAVREGRAIVDFVWTYLNPVAARIIERSCAALIGKRLLVEMPEARAAGLFDRCVRVVATGEPDAHEFFYPQGELQRWFRATAVKIDDGLAVMFAEITGRKSAESLAWEYQFLTDALPQMVWRMTARGTIDYVNERLAQYLGVKRDYMIGQGWAALDAAIHPDDLDETKRRRCQQGLGAGQVMEIEHRVRGADGAYRWHLTRTLPMKDARGRVLRWFGTSIDIEERKQVDQLLRRREEEFRALVENLPDLAWSARPDGHVDFYNRRVYEYTGVTFEQMNACGWQSVIDPAMADQVSARWQRSIDTGEPFEMEFPLRGADGVFRWFLTRVHPVRDEQGRIIRWFGTNTNIDEQRRLSDEREMFQALVEASDDLIAIAAPDGWGIYMNRAGRRLLGLDEHEDVSTRSIVELFDDDWLPRIMNEIVPELLAARTWSGEAVCKNLKTGEHIPVHSNAFGIPGPEPGQARLIAEVSRDLRPEKAAEKERVVLLAALDLLAKAGSVLASSLDVETTLQNVTHLIAPALADWCAVFLQDDSGAIQLAAVAHTNPAKESVIRELFVRYGAGASYPSGCEGVIRTGETELISDISEQARAGAAVDPEHLGLMNDIGTVSSLTVPLAVHGRTLGAMVLASCESGRHYTPNDVGLAEELGRRVAVALDNARLFEAAQVERRRSEAANLAKDDFLATVSHELRTPLNAMLGWTRMLRTGDLDAERQAKALDTIERNARAQSQLIEDLLDISRIITGNLRLDIRPVDLVQVVDAAIEVVKPIADAKDVVVQAILDPRVGTISGDPDRLEQVVWNLLSNAVKFTPSAGMVQVRLSQRESYLELAVEDTGQGIAPEFLPHVFERFRQADGGTNRVHGGLGLGLAIVKHIVELHGGGIQALSEGIGRGSTFVIRLPIAPFRNRNLPIPGSPAAVSYHLEGAFVRPPELRGLRVLVVDDEQDARDLIVAVLEPCGVEVQAAASAREAIELLESMRPEVLVSDIGMPGEDGYSLMQRVRALPAARGGRTPAVALTAYARIEDRTRALLAGFTMHMPKPIDPAELLVVLANVSGRLP